MGDKLKFENITAEFDAQDISSNKVLALVSYLGILVLIPIFAAKDSKFAKFHANQGLTLLIGNLALAVVEFVVGLILGLTLYKIAIVGSILSTLVGLVFWVIRIALFALAIYGIVCAVQGKAVKFPYFDKITILK